MVGCMHARKNKWKNFDMTQAYGSEDIRLALKTY